MAWHGMRGWFGWLACLLAHDDATAVVASLDMLRYPREEQQQACVCVCRSVCVYWGSGCVVIGLARDAPVTLRVLSRIGPAISRPKLALRVLWSVEALDGGLQAGALHCTALHCRC
jgi:hypothetical protein